MEVVRGATLKVRGVPVLGGAVLAVDTTSIDDRRRGRSREKVLFSSHTSGAAKEVGLLDLYKTEAHSSKMETSRIEEQNARTADLKRQKDMDRILSEKRKDPRFRRDGVSSGE